MAARTRKRTAKADEESKTNSGQETGDGQTVEDKLRAIHEAGHAVAMYRFGYSLGAVSIERTTEPGCRTKPEREIESIKLDAPDRRAKLESYLIVLYAGAVAEQILVPYVATTFSRLDHDDVHTVLDHEELGDAVITTWCAYLWEWSLAFVLDPRQWDLITYLAKALLAFRTISGKDATFLLKDEDNQNKTHSTAGRFGRGSEIVIPWHREWLRRAVTGKRETIEVDLSPLLRDVFKDVSKRAWNGLELANIKTVEELSRWNRLTLRRIKNVGPETIEEILRAAAKAGITLAPDAAPYPWTTGEEQR